MNLIQKQRVQIVNEINYRTHVKPLKNPPLFPDLQVDFLFNRARQKRVKSTDRFIEDALGACFLLSKGLL
jgi:hypothetical protein